MKEVFLLATGNTHKIKEVLALTPQVSWKTLQDFPQLSDFVVPETGESFQENALLKAQAYAEKTGLVAVAEDSGLEVEALGGKPGIYSARWVEGTDQDRNNALLQALAGQNNRQARYVAVACVFFPKTGEQQFFQGEVQGTIASESQGAQGFGYDPLFIPDGYTQTFAQLGSGVKYEVSHRKRAFEAFAQWYEKRFSSK